MSLFKRDKADAGEEGWYYNVNTREVEHGRFTRAADRLGPYATEADARRALETARERNDEWEAKEND
jgi:hypothetical protein